MTWKETEAPVSTVPTVEYALMDADALRPNFFVINGDLTNGKERDFRLAMRVLQRNCHSPIYFTMGNHEYYGYYEDPDFSCLKAQQQFLSFTGQGAIFTKTVIDNHTLFFLSTEKYTPALHDAGWLSTEQLDWFERELTSTAPGPVFVFFHQPLNDTVAKSDETCVQSAELQAILETRKEDVFLISGHTHQRMDIKEQLVYKNGVWYVGGGCPHGEFPQSRWFDVYADSVVIKLRNHKNQSWLEDFTYEVTW